MTDIIERAEIVLNVPGIVIGKGLVQDLVDELKAARARPIANIHWDDEAGTNALIMMSKKLADALDENQRLKKLP